MSIEKPETITAENFANDVAAKYRARKETANITAGFEASREYSVKAEEQRAAREKIEDELAAISAEALAVLGFDETKRILKAQTVLLYSQHHDWARLLEKILRHVVDNLQPKGQPGHRDDIAKALES